MPNAMYSRFCRCDEMKSYVPQDFIPPQIRHPIPRDEIVVIYYTPSIRGDRNSG